MPSNLPVSQQIKNIGDTYIQAYPKADLLGNHTNQSPAQKMAAYKPAGAQDSAEYHKIFLAKILLGLSQLAGKLYNEIQSICNESLGGKIDRYDMIRAISPELIREIGAAYVEKYPRQSFFHNNQVPAEKMKSFGINAKPGVEEMWKFLADIYAELPDVKISIISIDGTLGKSVAALFRNAFDIQRMPARSRTDAMGGAAYTTVFTPAEIAGEINALTAPGIHNASYAVPMLTR